MKVLFNASGLFLIGELEIDSMFSIDNDRARHE